MLRIPLSRHTTGAMRFSPPGRFFVSGWLQRWGIAGYEPCTTGALFAAWEKSPSGTFIDIGANCGLYAALCKRVFPQASVVAVEAAAAAAAAIHHVARDNDLSIRIEHWACSDEDGTAVLHHAEYDAMHSLNPTPQPEHPTELVKTRRLDTFCNEAGVAPSVLKIDVESHEPAVIRGAAGTLRQHQPIILIELLTHLDRFTPMAAEAYDLLEASGYRGRPLRRPAWFNAASPDPLPPRDWIMWPREEPADFDATYEAWLHSIQACDAS